MLVSEASKFAHKKAAQGATAEATRSLVAMSSNDELGQIASRLLGAAINILPKDVGKLIPAAQLTLDGNWSKFLSGDADGIKAALGALGSVLPPELAQLVGKASPLLTKGLESLLKDGGLPDLDSMLNADNLMGLAAQFLPPWAGDALSVGKALASGDIGAALDSVLSKYLPPELKAVYNAIKNLPGGWQQFLADLFNNPKTPQGAIGPWAARVTDAVACKGGAGPIQTGQLNVIIGGQFAARVTDVALCLPSSIPDFIDHGEPTVFIGGQWAARKGDFTAHNGAILTGFPKVHIGQAVNLNGCAECLKSGSSGGGTPASAGAGAGAGGAATISGSGMTAPLTGGCFGNPDGLGLGDALSNSLGDFAKDKIGGLITDKVGGLISNALGKSDQPKPKTEIPPQPKIHDDDDDFGVTKRN